MVGGNGGAGGGGSPIVNSSGGGGGGGGAGAVISHMLNNSASIRGGDGGQGGTGAPDYHGGGGGGGAGLFVTAPVTITNQGTIQGGNGGGSTAGHGAAANRGGRGGAGEGGALGGDRTGEISAGGAGIVGSDLTITNNGMISGGLAGDGVTRANAITFTGGVNSLTSGNATSGLTGNIAIDGSGSLALNQSNGVDTSIDNVITGNGSLHKSGAGAVTLSGVNTYTGGTHLLGGGLSVSADTNLGAATGDLTFGGGTLRTTATMAIARDVVLDAGGGTFDVNNGTATTLTASVTGVGGLVKTGLGNLALTSAGNYSGGTRVSWGTLIVQADGALGSGPVLVDGVNAIETSLAFDGVSAGDLLIDVQGGSLLFTNGASADNATINLDVTGSGVESLDFSGSSTAGSATITVNSGVGVRFRNTSSAQGATLVNRGFTIFYSDASAGSALIANRAGGRILFFNNTSADDATIVNEAGGEIDISTHSAGMGIGSLSGAGNVFLGSNELTLGALGLNDGIGGSIQDGGAGGAGGSLVKAGSGMLTLSGINTYTGATTINGGVLEIAAGGSIGSAATVNGGALVVNGAAAGVTVGAGGLLGGSGIVGNTAIASGGTLSPGNSIGTLNVTGNVAFTAGSTYEVEVDPAGQSDKTVATGMATINGGTVRVLAGSGSYAPQTDYTILTANGGRTGAFAGVSSNLAFLTPSLGYDANNVYLSLRRNDMSFAGIGVTPNQIATGAGVESLGFNSPVYGAVTGLSADQARAAFDQLSGEVHASTGGALIGSSRFVRDGVNERLRAAFAGVGASQMPVLAYGDAGGDNAAASAIGNALAPAHSARFAAWGSVFGSWGDTNGDGNAAGLDRSTGGFLTGLDGLVAENVRLGVMTGYSHDSFHVDDRLSSGSSDNYHLGLYGGTQWGNLGFRSGLAYTWHKVSTGRSVSFAGLADRLEADYDAGATQVFGEFGYRMDAASASLEPFANLAHVTCTRMASPRRAVLRR